MNVLRLTGALLIAAALVVFGAQNTQLMSFHFLIWETRSVPVLLALVIAVLFGVLLGWVASVPGRLRRRRERRALEHQVSSRANGPTGERSAPSDDGD